MKTISTVPIAIIEQQSTRRLRVVRVDLLRQPQLASGDQIIAILPLVRKFPKPMTAI
jgi:hypothetical protein